MVAEIKPASIVHLIVRKTLMSLDLAILKTYTKSKIENNYPNLSRNRTGLPLLYSHHLQHCISREFVLGALIVLLATLLLIEEHS